MSSYEHDSFEFETALTMNLSHSIRMWTIPGLHLKFENLPQNATILKTLVMMTYSGKWSVGLEWTVEGDTGYYFASIAEYSSLQELLDKLPEFAEFKEDLPTIC